jgi:hypothetical protein
MSGKSDAAATSAPAKYQRIPARANRTTAISVPVAARVRHVPSASQALPSRAARHERDEQQLTQ